MVFSKISPGLVACACVLSTANSLPAAGQAKETAVKLQSPSAPPSGLIAWNSRIFQRGHEGDRADFCSCTCTEELCDSQNIRKLIMCLYLSIIWLYYIYVPSCCVSYGA